MGELNIEQFRKELDDSVAQWTLGSVATIENIIDKNINENVGVRIYRNKPAGEKLPVLLFFHGGGWVRGSIATHDSVCRDLAVCGSFMVISVEYRLAPEHIFPSPVEDAFNTLNWLWENSDDIDADKNNIAVGGDSSGGNLAIALVQKAKDDCISLKGLIVAYPPIIHDFKTTSYERFKQGYGLTKDLMQTLWELYLGNTENGGHSSASVIKNDFTGFPPTLIIASDEDPLRDDGRLLFEKLIDAQVPVCYSFYPGTRHGFLLRSALEKEATRAVRDIVSFSKNNLCTFLTCQ